MSQLNELVSSLSEQGIYQGLAMTDQDKEEIGIMPECVYMATNLLENLGEHVVEEMETLASGEEDVRSRLGSKTDPNVFKPKIRRQLQHRASAPTSAQLPTSPQAVIPRYRNYLIRPLPLPPISQQATLAEGGVVLVSHDQHLIEACATEVWLCKEGTVKRLNGGLKEYRDEIQAEMS